MEESLEAQFVKELEVKSAPTLHASATNPLGVVAYHLDSLAFASQDQAHAAALHKKVEKGAEPLPITRGTFNSQHQAPVLLELRHVIQ